MVRVASLKAKIERGSTTVNSAGYTPKQLLKLVLNRTQELVNIQADRFRDVIIPELRAEGIEFVKIEDLTDDETIPSQGLLQQANLSCDLLHW
jgi:polyphosphate kinase